MSQQLLKIPIDKEEVNRLIILFHNGLYLPVVAAAFQLTIDTIDLADGEINMNAETTLNWLDNELTERDPDIYHKPIYNRIIDALWKLRYYFRWKLFPNGREDNVENLFFYSYDMDTGTLYLEYLREF